MVLDAGFVVALSGKMATQTREKRHRDHLRCRDRLSSSSFYHHPQFHPLDRILVLSEASNRLPKCESASAGPEYLHALRLPHIGSTSFGNCEQSLRHLRVFIASKSPPRRSVGSPSYFDQNPLRPVDLTSLHDVIEDVYGSKPRECIAGAQGQRQEPLEHVAV